MPRFTIPITLLLVFGASCDHGLEPPEVPPLGTLDVAIFYTGSWPPADSLVDLRFVAFRFMPRDTTDFFRLNEILFSPTLQKMVPSQRISIDSVQTGNYVYSGVAQRYSANLLDWRPVGLYADNGGVFTVQTAETTHVTVRVDFDRLPPFPPQ